MIIVQTKNMVVFAMPFLRCINRCSRGNSHPRNVLMKPPSTKLCDQCTLAKSIHAQIAVSFPFRPLLFLSTWNAHVAGAASAQARSPVVLIIDLIIPAVVRVTVTAGRTITAAPSSSIAIIQIKQLIGVRRTLIAADPAENTPCTRSRGSRAPASSCVSSI